MKTLIKVRGYFFVANFCLKGFILHTISAELERAQAQLLALRQKRQNGASSHEGGLGDLWQYWQAKQPLQLETLPTLPLKTIVPTTVRVPATVAGAFLQQGVAAIGRLWLLARACDTQGRGWLAFADLKKGLTEGIWRICGERQLRNLLRAGHKKFWEWQGDKVWLRGLAKVGISLGLERFKGRSVAITAEKLVGTMGKVRAQLYAVWHGGRKSTPIARATLQEVTGVSPSSQRNYEKSADIQAHTNFALGDYASPENWEKAALGAHGRHIFTLTDHAGNHGQAGRTYIAWQLPNHYTTSHTPCAQRTTRRTNRRIAGLLQLGTTGKRHWSHRFCVSAKSAVREMGESHWPSHRAGFWYTLTEKVWRR